MLTKKQADFLQSLDKSFVHGKNLLAKKNKNEIENFYEAYRKFHDELVGDKNLAKKVNALNSYKTLASSINNRNGRIVFKAQSKLEPTILEEFICQILKDKFGNGVLKYGSVKAYSSLYFNYHNKEDFSSGLELRANTKDQDVSIYRDIIVSIDNQRETLSIPIICIECKTYLDKTMLEGSVATALKIKNGNPKCLFFVVTETYDVADSVDIETSHIDNIYVLRKSRRKSEEVRDIQPDVVEHLVNSIDEHLKSQAISIEDKIQRYGYLRVKETSSVGEV